MLYRLKTDLPTFKAGDLFYIDRNGSLRHKNTDIVAYHYSTLAKFPDALEKFWEPVEEEFKRWRARYGNNYFCLDALGETAICEELELLSDSLCHAIGNYFQTRDEAQAYADYLKALAIVRDDAKGFVPDWGDSEQKRFIVYFDFAVHRLCEVDVFCLAHNGVFGLPHFATAEDARASIDKHEKEWLTIFGVKDETESDDE